jgi:hypothetical protein
LILDTDVFFFKKPEDLLHELEERREPSFVGFDNGRPTPPNVGADFFADRTPPEMRLNTGIVLFERNWFDISLCERYFRRYDGSVPHFIEQSAWNQLAYSKGLLLLDPERYHFKGRIHPETVCKHFTRPRRPEAYIDAIPFLEKEFRRVMSDRAALV